MDLTLIQKIAVYALPVLLAITVHEAAHAFAAKKLGDATAFMLGRMTLNPIKHIDLVGTIILPLIFLLLPGGFLFGWAKPVPVNFGALRNPKRDMRWVAAAGPLANLAMAIAWTLFFRLSITMDADNSFQLPLMLMSQAGVAINVSLMILNLIPIPPLDGGRILVSILPMPLAEKVSRIEPYGFYILMALLLTNTLGWIMGPFMAIVYRFLHMLV